MDVWSNPTADSDDGERIASHLVSLLSVAVRPGQEVQVAVNRELRAVIVWVDDEVLLSCSFDELLSKSPTSPN